MAPFENEYSYFCRMWEKFINLPSTIYAPLVALLIFFLGLFSRWVFSVYSKWSERLTIRRIIGGQIGQLASQLSKQSKNYLIAKEKFVIQNRRNYALPILEIYAYQLFDQMELKTIINAFRIKIGWLCFKDKIYYTIRNTFNSKNISAYPCIPILVWKDKHRGWALNKLLSIASTNKIWHERSKKDLYDFLDSWKNLQEEWKKNIVPLMKTFEDFLINYYSYPEIPSSYFLGLEAIYREWASQEDITAIDVIHTHLIEKATAHSRLPQYLQYAPIHRFVFELRDVSQVHSSMVNLLGGYNHQYTIYYSQSKADSKYLLRIAKLLGI
jgi:hypothetical protein